jgi:hypothetical protein
MCGYDLVVDANADKIRKNERERIIKLVNDWHFPVNQGTYTVDDSVKELIKLIKGETSERLNS